MSKDTLLLLFIVLISAFDFLYRTTTGNYQFSARIKKNQEHFSPLMEARESLEITSKIPLKLFI